jgi:hypothetical protein
VQRIATPRDGGRGRASLLEAQKQRDKYRDELAASIVARANLVESSALAEVQEQKKQLAEKLRSVEMTAKVWENMHAAARGECEGLRSAITVLADALKAPAKK